ncbi:putative multidrug ABC-type transport system, ATPase/permease fusion protein [Pseudomonas syringae pv. syringae str. B301D-R]|nr:hypothetical protein PsyrB_19895 [Pseudomonas syringae pv. syringae B301D]EXL29865.1 putative multidrug ABC-type transport system, ATPase/permease fusion protein [Pseudomonas syringae pv. syringae str. B301D-R]
MLYRRFEKLIDIFKDAPTAAPPNTVFAFYLYYLRQVWPTFTALLVVGLIGALIEVSLFSYLSRIIDLAQTTPPENFFSIHGSELIWMVVVALLLRPIFVGLHDLLVHQTISPGMTNLIRWQNHSHVLKQSVNFFQNDFAGRIAQRIMQTGNSLRDSAVQTVDALWHVLIYAISAMVLFAEADWRLMIPLGTWIAAFILSLMYFVPRVKQRSVDSSDARSRLMGRPLAVDPVHYLGGCDRAGHRSGHPHRQHVRLDHVGGQRHLREHRHRTGRPGKYFAARHGQ